MRNTPMMRFIKLGLLILALIGCRGAVAAADLWIGTCRNVTENMDGNLKLYANEATGRITGYISISGWLLGSGEITGWLVGNQIEFESKDSVQGVAIRWKGVVKDGRITGEYYVPAAPALGISRQVGEWSVSLYVGSIEKNTTSEDRFKKLFIFDVERDLNAPITLSNGSPSSGTALLFGSVHPIGDPVSVTVDSIQVVWADGTREFTRENLHKYRIELTLYWHGIIRTFGKTRLALTYNTKLGEYTDLDVLSTNGITKTDVTRVGTAVGILIAKSALDAILSDQ